MITSFLRCHDEECLRARCRQQKLVAQYRPVLGALYSTLKTATPLHQLHSTPSNPFCLGELHSTNYRGLAPAAFLFLYFLKSFFTEIYFRFHNLQCCTPTARLRGGRVPAANWRGGRDLNVNKIYF